MTRLVSCYFDTPPDTMWTRLARVLRYSASQYCPTWSREIEAMPATVRRAPANAAWVANTHKLDAWARTITQAAEGDRVLLTDTDAMICGPLDAAWETPFDVAITRRVPTSPFPWNAGVVFVRVTDRARRFFDAWAAENRRMLADPVYHQKWRKDYGGINQAALGALLARGTDATVAELPCRIWNCEDSAWDAFDAGTRIVHVKSALRRAIFHQTTVAPAVLPLARHWRRLEQAAIAEETRQAKDAGPPRPPGRPPGQPTVVYSVRLHTETYDACCRRALSNRESVAALIQRAVSEHLSASRSHRAE